MPPDPPTMLHYMCTDNCTLRTLHQPVCPPTPHFFNLWSCPCKGVGLRLLLTEKDETTHRTTMSTFTNRKRWNYPLNNNEYFYLQKKMKLPTEQHAEHLAIETEKQSGRRSTCMMKLSNTSYTTNTWCLKARQRSDSKTLQALYRARVCSIKNKQEGCLCLDIKVQRTRRQGRTI